MERTDILSPTRAIKALQRMRRLVLRMDRRSGPGLQVRPIPALWRFREVAEVLPRAGTAVQRSALTSTSPTEIRIRLRCMHWIGIRRDARKQFRLWTRTI